MTDTALDNTGYFKWGFWTTALQSSFLSAATAILVSLYIGQGVQSDDESVFLIIGLWTNTALILAAIIITHYLLLQRTLDFMESGRVESTLREIVEEVRRYPQRYTLIVFGYLTAVLFSLSLIVVIFVSFFVAVSWSMVAYVFAGWMLLSLPPAYFQYVTAEVWSVEVESRLHRSLEPPQAVSVPVGARLSAAFLVVLVVVLVMTFHLFMYDWSVGGMVFQAVFMIAYISLVVVKTTRVLTLQQEMMRAILSPFETGRHSYDDTRALWSAITDARQQLELWRQHRRDSEGMITQHISQVTTLLGHERIASADSGLTAIMASLSNLAVSQDRLSDEIETLRSAVADGITRMEKGMHLLDDSARSVHAVHEEAVASSRRAVELSQHMAQIEDVTRIIAYVTDQTRILAFNASIETAGAGELGERFGVVAKEIRQLAQNIGNSAETINRIIHDVRKATHISVMAVEKELKHAQEAMNKATEAQHAFSEVDSIINSVSTSAVDAGEDLRDLGRTQALLVNTMRDTETRLRELLGRQNDLSVSFSRLKDSFEKWSGSGL